MSDHPIPSRPVNSNVVAALRLCREWEDWVEAVIDPPTDGRAVPDLSVPTEMYALEFSRRKRTAQQHHA